MFGKQGIQRNRQQLYHWTGPHYEWEQKITGTFTETQEYFNWSKNLYLPEVAVSSRNYQKIFPVQSEVWATLRAKYPLQIQKRCFVLIFNVVATGNIELQNQVRNPLNQRYNSKLWQ